jgi:hypothetical protein
MKDDVTDIDAWLAEHGDVWFKAFAALPDTGPLNALLRSDEPLTPIARIRLAEMLSPGDPPIEEYKLTPTVNKGFARTLRGFVGAAEYYKRVWAGASSETAAEEAGSLVNVGPRQALRYVEGNVINKLRDRLKLFSVPDDR